MNGPGRSVTELGADLRGGRLSVRDLYEATLRSIRESDSEDPPLGAFLSTAGDDVEGSIEAAQRALDAGDDVGPLTGIPVAVKDNICTAGLATTCGSRILEGYRSPYEATVVRRLRRAGAIIVGKTNLDEFAMGSSTENSGFGPTRNPWDRGRVPGGSSGGSAAAVAGGLVPVALGSDTGGSIRQPASFCGVVGLKPTYGRVSRYGLVAFGSSLDQVGPIARTTEDAALVLQVIAGPDPLDSTAAAAQVPDYTRALESGIEGLCVGVIGECFSDDLDSGVRVPCERAIASLESLRAEVREVSLPHTRYAVPAYYLVAMAEASSNLARYDGVRYGFRAPGVRQTGEVYSRSRGAGFGAEVKRRIVLGTYGLSAGYYDQYYARGQRVRGLMAADFRRVFSQGIDLLFAPTSPTVAFPLGARVDDPVAMYLADTFTVPASLAGLPAVSVPVGFADGLPVGGQLVAAPFNEAVLLRAGRALELALAPGGGGA